MMPDRRDAMVGAVLSSTAILIYFPYFWLLYEDRVIFNAATAATAFVLPALLALAPRLPGRAAREPLPWPVAD